LWIIWIFPRRNCTQIGDKIIPSSDIIDLTELECNLNIKKCGWKHDPVVEEVKLSEFNKGYTILFNSRSEKEKNSPVIAIVKVESSVSTEDIADKINKIEGEWFEKLGLKEGDEKVSMLLLVISDKQSLEVLKDVVSEFTGGRVPEFEDFWDIKFSTLAVNNMIVGVVRDERRMKDLGIFISASLIIYRHLVILYYVNNELDKLIEYIKSGNHGKPSLFYWNKLIKVMKYIDKLNEARMREYFCTEDCWILFKKIYRKFLKENEDLIRKKIEFLQVSIGFAINQMEEERSAEILRRMEVTERISEETGKKLTSVTILLAIFGIFQFFSYIEMNPPLFHILISFIITVIAILTIFIYLRESRPPVDEDILPIIQRNSEIKSISKKFQAKVNPYWKLDFISANLSGGEWHIILKAYKKSSLRKFLPIKKISLDIFLYKEGYKRRVGSVLASIPHKSYNDKDIDDLAGEILFFLRKLKIKEKGGRFFGDEKEIYEKIKELIKYGKTSEMNAILKGES
jgi:hypothetical protein